MKRARAESSAESSPKLLKLEAREGRAPPDLPAEGDQKCVVYIVDKKIPSAQLSHLKSVAQKKDFTLATSIKYVGSIDTRSYNIVSRTWFYFGVQLNCRLL